MEPLSITVACTSLLQAIGGLSKLINTFVREARDARKDVDAFNRELSSLSLCVSILNDDSFAWPDELQNTLCSVLADCEIIIENMKKILTKHRARDIGRNIRWAFSDRNEVLALQIRLEARKTTLNITIDMASLVLLKAVKNDTAQIKEHTSAIKEDTTDIKAELEALRIEVTQFRLEKAGSNPMLNRFLSDAAAYTESIIDPFEGREYELSTYGNQDSGAMFSQVAMAAHEKNFTCQQHHQSEELVEPALAAAENLQGSPVINYFSGDVGAGAFRTDSDRESSGEADSGSIAETRRTEDVAGVSPKPRLPKSIQSSRDVGLHHESTQAPDEIFQRSALNNAVASGHREPEQQNFPLDAGTKRSNSDAGVSNPRSSSPQLGHDEISVSKIEEHVTSVLSNCGSSIADKEGALLWYMLQSLFSNDDEIPRTEWILQQGVNVNAALTERMKITHGRWLCLMDTVGFTALHLCVWSQLFYVNPFSAAIPLLVKHGAHVNNQYFFFSKDGVLGGNNHTAFSCAIQVGIYAAIRRLLHAGASKRLEHKGLAQYSALDCIRRSILEAGDSEVQLQKKFGLGVLRSADDYFATSLLKRLRKNAVWRRETEELDEELIGATYRK